MTHTITHQTKKEIVNFCQADIADSDASITSHQQSIKTASATSAANATASSKKAPATRSGSTDSTTSTESSASSTTMTPAARNHQTSTTTAASAKQTTKPEVPVVSNRPRGSIELVPEKKPFQSRFLPNHQTKKDETESSSSEEETSSEETDDDEDEPVSKSATVNGTARDSHNSTSAGRSSQPRDTYDHARRRVSGSGGGYNSPTYGRDSDDTSRSAATSTTRSRATAAPHHNDYDDHGSSRYGSGSSRWVIINTVESIPHIQNICLLFLFVVFWRIQVLFFFPL